MNQKKKNSTTAMFFVLFLLGGVVGALVLSKLSFDKTKKIETVTSEKNIDSIIKGKVNDRFYSYDNYFFHTNSIVLDSLGNKIGEIFILTNDVEIEEFYSDTTRTKTKYYENLKNRKLKIKDKEL